MEWFFLSVSESNIAPFELCVDQQVSGTGSGSRHFQNQKKYQVKTSNVQRIENFSFKMQYFLAEGTSSFFRARKTFTTGMPIFLYASLDPVTDPPNL
jgi:hypothetical protein